MPCIKQYISTMNQIGCQNFCTVAKQDCSYTEKKLSMYLQAKI